MKILALTPAFNVAPYLASVISDCRKHVSDILVIDDGSRDNAFDIAKAAGVDVIRHETNRGKGAALKTGFAYAMEHDYDVVITLDGDGQHDPKYIPEFIEAYKTLGQVRGPDLTKSAASSDLSADKSIEDAGFSSKTNNISKAQSFRSVNLGMIIGSRIADKADMPWQRRCSNYLTSHILSRFLHAKIEDSQSGYRLIDVAMLRQLNLRSDYYQLETEIIIKAVRAGFAIGFVPIKVIYGAKYPTSIHGWKDTFRWIKLVLEEI